MKPICLTLLFGCLAGWPVLHSTRADTVVVPSANEHSESDGFLLGFRAPGHTNGLRSQTVYHSSLFVDAMPNGGRITEIAYRVDGPNGNAIDGVVQDLEVRMSTTTTMRPAGSMFPFYTVAQNVGADERVVFGRGSLEVQSTWSRTGPNPFLLRIPFTTPFEYHPQAGNLLVDTVVYRSDAAGRVTFDMADSFTVRTIYAAGNEPRAELEGYGPVMQVVFTPIPEPSVNTVFLLGFFLVFGWRRAVRWTLRL